MHDVDTDILMFGLNFILFVSHMTSIQSNTEYDYNTIAIQMGFKRKSNDLFESVAQEFTLLIYILSYRHCHLCRE